MWWWWWGEICKQKLETDVGGGGQENRSGGRERTEIAGWRQRKINRESSGEGSRKGGEGRKKRERETVKEERG